MELEHELSTITSILLKAQELFLIVQYLYSQQENEDLLYIKKIPSLVFHDLCFGKY